uniref:Uncharacterized protein n=1 Tax=Anguilla anguilla TaxID=7936 RepID=A0A0E9SXR3_ANGAN
MSLKSLLNLFFLPSQSTVLADLRVISLAPNVFATKDFPFSPHLLL